MALQAFSGVVRSQLRRNDILARVGGDEFVIAAFVGGPEDLRAIEQKIESALDDYNIKSQKPYRLTCSIGSKFYESFCDVHEALADADGLMYEQKRAKKDSLAKHTCYFSGSE